MHSLLSHQPGKVPKQMIKINTGVIINTLYLTAVLSMVTLIRKCFVSLESFIPHTYVRNEMSMYTYIDPTHMHTYIMKCLITYIHIYDMQADDPGFQVAKIRFCFLS